MNTTRFSDKQIMDLMNDNISNDGDHQRSRVDDTNDLVSKKEAIVPSYDFQPIRPNATVGLSHSALDLAGSVNSTAARGFTASDFYPVKSSARQSYGSVDSIEPSKLFAEKERTNPETAILSEIDRVMKKHADDLMNVMEGVSARLTQLESRTRNLENLVDDVKVSVGNSHGNTDGKMRQLENIMLEVQSGVQLLKDKQEILEAQLQLSKLQVPKVDQRSDKHSTHVEHTAQPPAALPQPPASAAAPPSLTQQGLPPQQFIQQHSLQAPSSQLPQLPSQFPPQQESYFSPPGGGQSQPPPVNNPPYQPPPPPQTQSLHQPPYQPPPQQPQYPQQPPPQLQQPSSGYNPEEPPYPYSSNPPRQQPPPAPATSQQYYNNPPTPPSMYDGPGGRSSSGFPSGYSPETYPYTTPPSSQFGNTQTMKPSHQSGGGGGGGSGYPQIPMARPLPQALPMATAISSGGSGGGGSGSPRSGSNVPVDDVIDKVSSMGFPRDQVRGTVRALTENGQAVDLNTVLDKLMNGGVMQQQQQQPPRGWFGGR
ncbi:hypothetical protein YC2023_014051 [Brassica napus]|uniref:(rape) hypothetical protein n=1 Tax=Brassica napus TaxID=3708 RepID=A0A816JUK6_BRANA|nr:unnamed protein product [Brassica napus]